MDYDNYLSEYDEDLKVGDIIVYDNSVGGNTAYCFLKIVSFVKNTTIPRVVPLECVNTETVHNIEDSRYITTPGKPTTAISQTVNKTKDGFCTWKKCRLELYNPDRKYWCIRYKN